MEDEFKEFGLGLTSPACAAEAVVPSDTEALNYATRCIFVGGAGDLNVRLVDGDIVTLTNVNSGVIYPIRVDQVLATGTTATGLVGLR